MEYAVYMIMTMVVILALAAIGGSLTERSGVINLSIEGFMTIGAISYALLVSSSKINDNLLSQFWAMPVAGLIAGLFAILYALVTVKLKANQTIAGIAFNIFALAISIFIIHSKLNPQASDKIEIQSQLWSFVKDKGNLLSIFNIVLLYGLPTIAIIFIVLNKTKYGIKIKASGEQPQAATSLGINVPRIQFMTIMLSGAVSGMAGAMFAQFKFSYFYGSTQGIGFLAVALVIFGQWRPSYIFLGAVLFGGIYGLIESRPYIEWLSANGNPILLNIIPYAISIIVLIITQRNSKVPKALGIPFRHHVN